MGDVLGAWSNAPLAYVLAEVRTELLADIKEYQPKLAGRLRDVYPLQRMMHSARIVAGTTKMMFEPEQEPAWEYATPDNRTGVIVRNTGVVLHATQYQDSEHFLKQMLRVLMVLVEEVPAIYVNRIGFRYLDFILPNAEETPEHYVDQRLNPDLGITSDGNLPAVTSLAIYPMQRGHLTLRYSRTRGQPELPPDLAGLSLDPSPLMQKSPLAKSVATAILDTDRVLIYSPVLQLKPDQIYDDFIVMRDDIRKSFHAATTAHARKVWGA